MRFVAALAAVLVISMAGSATADDNLAAFGLGGMQKVSDAEGEQVRGHGAILFAFGFTQVAVDGPLPIVEPGNVATGAAAGGVAGGDLSTNAGSAGVVTAANNGVPILGVINDGAAASTTVFWSY